MSLNVQRSVCDPSWLMDECRRIFENPGAVETTDTIYSPVYRILEGGDGMGGGLPPGKWDAWDGFNTKSRIKTP